MSPDMLEGFYCEAKTGGLRQIKGVLHIFYSQPTSQLLRKLLYSVFRGSGGALSSEKITQMTSAGLSLGLGDYKFVTESMYYKLRAWS